MKKLIWKFSISALVSMVMFISSFSQVFAEDIEIYNRLQTEPNVLFIIDQSESMLQMVGTTGKTRDQIVKEAFQTVMSQSYGNLNVGFMDYGRDNGAGVDLPIADINQPAKNVEPGVNDASETYASLLSRFANNLEGPQSNAKTALVEALLEAAKYYRGDVIDNLSQGIGNQGTWNDSLSQYTGGHWRAAGPRTLTTGGSSTSAGSNCHQAGSPAGAPYSQCSNPYPGSCQNLSAKSGTYQSCTGGTSCTEYDITGTECVTSVCNGYTTKTWSHPAYTRCKETSTSTAKTYISPIQTACTKNFIVLLSDGAPTILGSHEQTSIQGFAGTSSCTDLSTLGFTNSSILSKGVCGPDLTQAISTLDIATSIPGTQTVDTYTIGFDLGAGANEAKTYLELLASNGNGQFFDANGSGGVTGLVTIFQNIFNSISQKPRTISRAALSLDVESLAGNRSEVYLSMFADDFNQPRWQGNVKGYTFDPVKFLKGLDGNAVFDSVGDFSTSSRSYWTLAADGGTVGAGGVANVISHSSRNALTDNGAAGTSINFTSLNTSNFDDDDLAVFNLTSTGDDDDDEDMIHDLINWARGQDVFDEDGDASTDERHFVGDILHSNPVIAQYDTTTTPDGTVDKRVMFMMTNEGYLHAFDVTSNTSASELFAFMPRALLPNLDTLQKNVGGTSKVYGLDGHLVLHQDGGITDLTGTKTLYFGMRRGGRNYYSMDVTDPANPTLNWVIEGGSTGFEELGQTWSQPTVTKIKTSSGDKKVLIFAGGYDTNKDTNYSADSVGRAIYIVDAATGAKIFSAGPGSSPLFDLNLPIQDSIAADILDIDFDNDGIVDRLYAADTGGHIWRIDIDASTFFDSTPTVGANAYSGYLFAELHGSGSANERRFYARPDAAYTGVGKLAIVVGSGYRAHPLDNGVQDRLYTILDPHPAKSDIPSTFTAITESSLVNNTTFLTLETDGDTTNNITPPFSFALAGWYYDLTTDEKVFNSPILVGGTAFFTTYIPPSSTCSSIPDGSQLFAIGLDGKPSIDLDGNPSNGTQIVMAINTHGINPDGQIFSSPPPVVSIPDCGTDPTLPGCDCIADSSLAHCTCEAYPYLQKCSNACEGGGLDLIIGTNKVPLNSGRCIQEEFWTSKPN